jgi:hypothetical protein
VPELLATLPVTRIVSTADALDTVVLPDAALMLRTAADEAIVIHAGEADPGAVVVDDPHAIVVADAGWCGGWIANEAAVPFLDANCSWARPVDRPAFAQGMVAHLPVKLWLEEDRTLFVVPHVSAHELTHRLREGGVA